MRVAIATQEYPPDTGWGGIGSFSFGLAHALAAEGVDVDVVSCVAGQPESHRSVGRITVHRTGLSGWSGLGGRLHRHLPATTERVRVARAVRRAIRELPHEPDVVEAPEWMAESLLLRGRVVVHLHSPFAVLNRRRHLPPNADRRIAELLERVAVQRASAITLPSYQALALDATHDWIRPRSTSLAGMPLDAETLADHDTQRPEPLVVMIGRLDRLKAPEILLDALALLAPRVHGLRAVLAGHANQSESPAGTDYLLWLRQRADQLSLNVELPGPLPRDDVRALLRRARVLAVPSRFESFSMAAAEALACATPVVVTNECGIAGLLHGAYPNAVIPTEDARALADALLPPLLDERESRRRGELGRALIRATCEPSEVARQRLRLYATLGAR